MKNLAMTAVAVLALACAGCKADKPRYHRHPQQAKVVQKAPPPKVVQKAPPKKAMPKPQPPKKGYPNPVPPKKH